MSFFSSKAASNVQNVWPVTESTAGQGFGRLSDDDTKWACTTGQGFKTETQVWYTILPDGAWVMVQVIWSYTGIMFVPATSQMTFKYYNPTTKQATWKSVNVGSWKPDGRGCKSDHFDIKHTGTAAGEESYAITANLDKTVQITATFTRPSDAPGFKYGQGEKGGFSYLGKDKTDGFVIHRFHPLVQSTGTLVLDGKVIDLAGEACFIHAIQGMRPDSLASRWNFAFFTSGGGKAESKLGKVRAISMEFATTDSYGPKGAKSGRTVVSVGAVYSSALGQPLIAVGQTSVPTDPSAFPSKSGEVCSATQLNPIKDSFTGYSAPGGIEFAWAGKQTEGGKGQVEAKVHVDKLGITDGEGGLIEKVDVLAEIPYVIRKTLAAVTGTKPYIYQYLNPTTLNVKVDGEETPVEGWLFNEASFVSE